MKLTLNQKQIINRLRKGDYILWNNGPHFFDCYSGIKSDKINKKTWQSILDKNLINADSELTELGKTIQL